MGVWVVLVGYKNGTDRSSFWLASYFLYRYFALLPLLWAIATRSLPAASRRLFVTVSISGLFERSSKSICHLYTSNLLSSSMSHPKTAIDTNLLSNTTLPTVVFGPNRAHTYYGHASDCPCGAAGFPCTRWGTIDWCPTNSLGLHYANAASDMHPSAYVSMILAYSFMAFFALRTMIRTSTTALIGLSLIVGGLIYDVNVGFTGVQASASTGTDATRNTTALITSASSLTLSSATAVVHHLTGWECGVIGQWCSGQRSGAMSKLALPGFWLVMLVVVVCWLGLANGQLRDAATASPKAPQSIDGEQLDNSLATKATKTTALPEHTDEPSYSVEYRPLAGGLFAHTVKVKRSDPAVKDEESKDFTTVQDTRPGTTKLAVLFALFLLALVMVPMALAEPTSTRVSSKSLALPSPAPTTTTFDATATAYHHANNALDVAFGVSLHDGIRCHRHAHKCEPNSRLPGEGPTTNVVL